MRVRQLSSIDRGAGNTDNVTNTILLLPVLLERRDTDLASARRNIRVKDLGRKGTYERRTQTNLPIASPDICNVHLGG